MELKIKEINNIKQLLSEINNNIITFNPKIFNDELFNFISYIKIF